MVQHIRPHHLFEKIATETYLERVMRVVIPTGGPGPILLETAVLVALARLVGARSYFEIGTFLGVETLNVAMNLPEDAVVYTLDLDRESFQEIAGTQMENDRHLSELHMARKKNLAFMGTPFEKRITCLTGDSTRFDYAPYRGRIGFVYVDGGHDLQTVRADTQNALTLLPPASPGCVAWHDYGNPMCPDLTRFIEELAGELTIYHVEETMICFTLRHVGVAGFSPGASSP
jgi:hypothetical protein